MAGFSALARRYGGPAEPSAEAGSDPSTITVMINVCCAESERGHDFLNAFVCLRRNACNDVSISAGS